MEKEGDEVMRIIVENMNDSFERSDAEWQEIARKIEELMLSEVIPGDLSILLDRQGVPILEVK